jgi:hypothetical protein
MHASGCRRGRWEAFFKKNRWEVGHVVSRQESKMWLVGWLVRAPVYIRKSIIRKGRKEKRVKKKYIIKLPGSLATFGNFKRISRPRPILIFPTMCNTITKISFLPQDHSLPFAHVHLSKKCVFFSPPSAEHYFPMNFLTSLGNSMRLVLF